MEQSTPSKSSPKQSRVFVLLVLSLVLIAGSLFLTGRKDTDTIIVTFPSGKEIEAEVADTPEKLLFGLAFRDGLPPDSGMLYIFETSDRHRVRTKGFKIPVDMIWVDASRHVVHLVERADPCPQDPCPLYGPPPENARYVIQTAAGFLEQERLAPGAELKFTLRL
ncbi:MAG: DUF192 domain-containing protein [Nitrospirota bacterium]